MKSFNSGYAKVNNHFIIKNLNPFPLNFEVDPVLLITQNLLIRGNPTIASPYILNKLNLERGYLDAMEPYRIISETPRNWRKTIKGDEVTQNIPAHTFYEDLRKLFNASSYLADTFIAECSFDKIVENSGFSKQLVDFYSPLLKCVIEIDGYQHQKLEQKKLDEKRDLLLTKQGIHVYRLSTADVQQKNYSNLLTFLRKQYKENNNKIALYDHFLKEQKKASIHIQLTEIYRFKMAVLELLKVNQIDLNSDRWEFIIENKQQHNNFKLAVEDLFREFHVIQQLLNRATKFPEIVLSINGRGIRIDNQVGMYWDDSLTDDKTIYIREDDFVNLNNRYINTGFIVQYNLDEQQHVKPLAYISEILFGYTGFKEGQVQIIVNALNRKDTVGLLPTGGGKSLTYQICTFLQPAISFVVAPIKSLMLDQVENLRKKHYIDCINYINSDLAPLEAQHFLKEYEKGKYLFLVISPERFQQKEFRKSLQLIQSKNQFAFAVIDEAHCLSEWGHDFRTSYLALAKTVRKYTPTAVFLALTATASSKVLQDIRNELRISSQDVKTITNFTRKELNFHVIQTNKRRRNSELVQLIESNVKTKTSAPIVVFTSVVNGENGCYKLSQQLKNQLALKSEFFCGSQPREFDTDDFSKYKEQVHYAFMNNEIDILFATKAFGMGIDKPDVRNVIHYGIPSSLESYYQEAGRAGRDKNTSDCYILFSKEKLTEEQRNKLFGMKTDVNESKKLAKLLNGDLNTNFFFFNSSIKDLEEETKEISHFYEKNLKGYSEVRVKNYNDNEKIIYRLALLGIVEDWTMDWKLNDIIVEMNEFNEQMIEENLFNHIQKYDSLFTVSAIKNNKDYSEYNQLYFDQGVSILSKYMRILLKWYNDNVIYSRKQSLKNIYDFVMDFSSSEQLQHKIELYFKRNDDVYMLENTIAHPKEIKNWWKIYYVVNNELTVPKNEMEIKDLTYTLSRFVESYQNDPTLNLILGMTDLILKGELRGDNLDRLEQALEYIRTLNESIQREVIISIFDVANEFLSDESKNILSKRLIEKGFNSIQNKKFIYKNLQDDFSLGSIVKEMSTKMSYLRSNGGYPWEN